MLNSTRARPKQSGLERMTGTFVVVIFLTLVVMCTFCALTYSLWELNTGDLAHSYITDQNYSFMYNLGTRLGNWLLIFGNFVPISMLLTLEMAKFCQGYIMGVDKNLISNTGFWCKVQSSNLNEELGQIDYIFSDKTGTLTQNEMRFKYLVLGSTVLGEKTGYNGKVPTVTNVDFSDPRAWQLAKEPQSPLGKLFYKASELMAVCHTIVLEKNGDLNASSPDELAFVNVAKLTGCEFQGMDDENNIKINQFGQDRRYKLLDVFEFNSDRKRMSVIVQDEKNQITLFCKGADSIMLPRYNPNNMPESKELMKHVDSFAEVGLRTLLLGYKDVSPQEYQAFKSQYDAAKNNMNNREAEMSKVEDQFERGMTLVGATAIEDRLQDQVADTIEFIRQAGIKVWVLTGDKVDTAKNIGYSCNLLERKGMEVLQYEKNIPDLYQATRNLESKQIEAKNKGLKTAYLVAADTIETITSKQHQALYEVTPKQKAQMVALVQEALPHVSTLAIGDGANDVNMICEAHVGVGIKGVEGQQAARSADFAIGEFKLLKRLLMFHGRESYRKNSNLVLYNFFKNILLNCPLMWFGYYNYFSGSMAYDNLGFALFNLLFTSFPIGIYSLFDRQTTDTVLMRDPKYYEAGPKKLFFNLGRFALWFGWAILYSFLIFLIVLYLFDVGFATEKGNSYGFFMTGQVVFFIIIVASNFKLFSFAHSYSIIFIFLILLSTLFAVLTWVMVSFFDFDMLEHSFERVMGSIRFWTALFIVLGIGLFDWAVTKLNHYTVWRYHFPPANEEEFMMELDYNPPASFVRNCTPEHKPERSNTLNFSEALVEDHPDEEQVAAELLKKKNEPSKQLEMTGFDSKPGQGANQPLLDQAAPYGAQNQAAYQPQYSPVPQVYPGTNNYSAAPLGARATPLNLYNQPVGQQFGQPVSQSPQGNYYPPQYQQPRSYDFQPNPRTIYR